MVHLIRHMPESLQTAYFFRQLSLNSVNILGYKWVYLYLMAPEKVHHNFFYFLPTLDMARISS
jgi:hypothetical protein